MDKEINEDARTKQDLLYECSILESRLSNEIIKNENLKQQCKKQKEVIDKAIKYIKSYKTDYSPYELSDYNIRQILDILKEVE